MRNSYSFPKANFGYVQRTENCYCDKMIRWCCSANSCVKKKFVITGSKSLMLFSYMLAFTCCGILSNSDMWYYECSNWVGYINLWCRYYPNEEMHSFFHTKAVQKMMANILFSCAKENYKIGYYQVSYCMFFFQNDTYWLILLTYLTYVRCQAVVACFVQF